MKTLVVDDKWMATVETSIGAELKDVSQSMTKRVCELAERYSTALPILNSEIDAISKRVEQHLAALGQA